MLNSRFLSRNLPSDRISLMMMSSRLSLSLSLDPLVSAFPESIIQTKHHINTMCEKTQTILYLVKLRVIYQLLLSSPVPKPPRPNPNPEPSSKTKGIGADTKILSFSLQFLPPYVTFLEGLEIVIWSRPLQPLLVNVIKYDVTKNASLYFWTQNYRVIVLIMHQEHGCNRA